MFDKSLACSIVHSLAALVEVGVADCRLSSLPSCCFSSPSRGSPGCFASSWASCGLFSLRWWCRGSGRSAAVGTQAKPGLNVSCWGRPFSRRWCFAFLAAGESTRLVILFRVLLRDKQCMFSRGFWCWRARGRRPLRRFRSPIRCAAIVCRLVQECLLCHPRCRDTRVRHLLRFLVWHPKTSQLGRLVCQNFFGSECPKCCHPLPLPALSQCDLVSRKRCRQPSTLVMDFVRRIELPGIPGVFWRIQPDGWIMSLASWCVSL